MKRTTKRELQSQVGFKAPRSKYERYKEAAATHGLSFNSWLIKVADAACDNAVTPESDQELDAAIRRLLERMPVGDRKAIMRACVILVDRANQEEGEKESLRVNLKAPRLRR